MRIVFVANDGAAAVVVITVLRANSCATAAAVVAIADAGDVVHHFDVPDYCLENLQVSTAGRQVQGRTTC